MCQLGQWTPSGLPVDLAVGLAGAGDSCARDGCCLTRVWRGRGLDSTSSCERVLRAGAARRAGAACPPALSCQQLLGAELVPDHVASRRA